MTFDISNDIKYIKNDLEGGINACKCTVMAIKPILFHHLHKGLHNLPQTQISLEVLTTYLEEIV